REGTIAAGKTQGTQTMRTGAAAESRTRAGPAEAAAGAADRQGRPPRLPAADVHGVQHSLRAERQGAGPGLRRDRGDAPVVAAAGVAGVDRRAAGVAQAPSALP